MIKYKLVVTKQSQEFKYSIGYKVNIIAMVVYSAKCLFKNLNKK